MKPYKKVSKIKFYEYLEACKGALDVDLRTMPGEWGATYYDFSQENPMIAYSKSEIDPLTYDVIGKSYYILK